MATGITLRPALTLTQQVDALLLPHRRHGGLPAGAGDGRQLGPPHQRPKDQMQSLEQPILVLAQAVQQPPAAEQRDGFARAALASNQTMKDFVIERAQSYRSNGVDWHEIVARALDQPTNQPVVVMQTIRFAPDGYIRALGVVRQDQRDGVLAKFRQVVDSLQVK
ncbi:hypothetical protein ACU4GA_17720 [Methylobacterium oryzae CBMB20]